MGVLVIPAVSVIGKLSTPRIALIVGAHELPVAPRG